MPTVPLYDGPKVQQAALQGGELRAANVSTERAGKTAGAIGGALDATAQLGERIQQRRDLDDAFRVETKVLSDYSAFEANLRKTRRGAAAKDITNDVDTWWSKLDDNYGEGVSPQVKELTKKSLARARMQSVESMGRYQAGEEDRAQVESFTSVNQMEIQRATEDGRPEAVEAARGKIASAVNAFGATRGWDADQIAAKKLELSDQLYTVALEGFVNAAKTPERVKAARDFYAANKGDIKASRYGRFDEMLDKVSAQANATDNAAKWSALSFGEAIANANKVTNPDERALTLQAVRSLQSDKNTANSLREKEASDTAWQMKASKAPLSQLPETVLRAMDGRDRESLVKAYEVDQRHREAEAKGRDVKTDPAVYGKVLDLLREDPAGTRPEAFTGLSRGDTRSLQNHRDSLLGKTPRSAGEVASTEQQMGAYVNALRLKDEKKGLFQQAAYNEFNQFREKNKREPDYEERQKIFDLLTIKKDGGWFGSNQRFFEVPTTERGKFVDSVVPAADRNAIVETLNKRNRPVTAQAILDMYQNRQVK